MPARACDRVDEQHDAAARALIAEALPPRMRALLLVEAQEIVRRRRAGAFAQVGHLDILEAVDHLVAAAAVYRALLVDHHLHPAHAYARLAALADSPAFAIDEDAAAARRLVHRAHAFIAGF